MTHLKFPFHGYAGGFLVLVFWYINWYGQGLRTHWAFFPLWLGYILCIDGVAVYRGQRSLIIGNWLKFGALFLISIPIWWLFEWLNKRAEYWIYLPEDTFTPLAHTFWSTLSFSTVVPVIFVTTNALLSITWFRRHHIRWRTGHTRGGRAIYFIIGILLLIALLIWPQYGMAFMWVSLFFIVCPINFEFKRPSLMAFTARKDWRMVLVLFASALICGVFWEMWNIYSWPKWIYTFPYLDQFKVFEMPLAGYLGYLPFGLEVWALTALCFPDIPGRLVDLLEKSSSESELQGKELN